MRSSRPAHHLVRALLSTRARALCLDGRRLSSTRAVRGARLGSTATVTTTRRTATATAPQASPAVAAAPFRFETGVALYAKRPPRPFPPPFTSPPSGSFSDPLSTHNLSRNRRFGDAVLNGELIRGYTNGDDAVYVSDRLIIANDGVGAWSTREGGHAGLWSRLIVHFWALETDREAAAAADRLFTPDPVGCLQRAYEQTIDAASHPNKWSGTTTAAGALLHYDASAARARPLLYATNLGDSQILVIRPQQQQLVYKSQEQWHWFDCPRQLGTNSLDTPRGNAVLDVVDLEEHDVVLAVSDGVIDNLWEHEIVENISDSVLRWEQGEGSADGHVVGDDRRAGVNGGMQFVAEQLMTAARKIAEDPFAESPFMERAVEEGLAMEGGKLDDISVVAALCRKNR